MSKAGTFRDLRELPKDPVGLLTGHRFEIIEADGGSVVDTDPETATKRPLRSDQDIESLLLQLSKDLALIANHRVRNYDALLNSVESWLLVLDFIEAALPGLLTVGVLQPLIDLDAFLHDLVVRRKSGLLASRDRLFDGGYRWIESFEYVLKGGERPRRPSPKAIRKYQDKMEGRICVVWLALELGLSKEDVEPKMGELLRAARIRNCDDQLTTAITAEIVKEWFVSVQIKGRTLGRRFCYQKIVENKEHELESCKNNPERAIQFAMEQLEWVRCRQPINRPIPSNRKGFADKKPRTGPKKKIGK